MQSSPPSAVPPVKAPDTAPITAPTRRHWLWLALLVLLGGSSFGGIRIALESAPAAVISAGRLWVSALVLTIYMVSTGRKMLPLREKNGKISSFWGFAAAIGMIGYTIPMFLFPFAQQSVSTMLAGIYMAFMPIITVFLAAIYANEPLTRGKLIGFAAGTLGVVILIGPDAISGLFTANVVAQLAMLLATFCYAVTSVTMRRAPDQPVRSMVVAFTACAAIFATPTALLHINILTDITLRSWSAIIFLGVFPTALASILIVQIIRGAGAGFMAQANYATPLVAIVIGILMFEEKFEWRYGLGLITILSGLTIAQPATLRTMRQVIKSITKQNS